MACLCHWRCLVGRSVLALLLWGAAQVSVAGQVPAGGSDRQTLVVAAYAPLDDLIRSVAPRWKKLHPQVDLRVLTRAFEEHHSVTLSALKTASHVPDVLAIEVSQLGQFAAAGKLERLNQPPFLTPAVQASFVPYALAQSRDAENQVLAIPADVGPATLLYRLDVLERAGVDPKAFNQSWATFLKAGLQIRKTTGVALVAHARNVADIVLQANLREGEGVYFDRQGRPVVQAERFVRAFELAREVRRLGLDAQLTAFTEDWTRGVRDHRIATLMSGSWMAGHLATWLAPDQRGKWRVTQLPEQTWAYMGGTFYAIPKMSKHKDWAWDLVQMLTLEREVQWAAFHSHHAFPALLAAHTGQFIESPVEYLGQQAALGQWRDVTQRVRSTMVSEHETRARSVIHTELEKVLTQGKDVRHALQDASAVLARWSQP